MVVKRDVYCGPVQQLMAGVLIGNNVPAQALTTQVWSTEGLHDIGRTVMHPPFNAVDLMYQPSIRASTTKV
jgi:hypothetical protein